MKLSPEQIDILKKWETSGVSQTAFCRQADIPLSTFTYWRKKSKAEEQPLVKIEQSRTIKAETALQGTQVICRGIAVMLSGKETADFLKSLFIALRAEE